MNKAIITIEKAPKLALRRERRQPWIFNYAENGFSFGGWNGKGGITKAKSFAKQLKRRMNTDPEILIATGE